MTNPDIEAIAEEFQDLGTDDPKLRAASLAISKLLQALADRGKEIEELVFDRDCLQELANSREAEIERLKRRNAELQAQLW